jgi:hypothetical protein
VEVKEGGPSICFCSEGVFVFLWVFFSFPSFSGSS